jgi:hypothetical protein
MKASQRAGMAQGYCCFRRWNATLMALGISHSLPAGRIRSADLLRRCMSGRVVHPGWAVAIRHVQWRDDECELGLRRLMAA